MITIQVLCIINYNLGHLLQIIQDDPLFDDECKAGTEQTYKSFISLLCIQVS